MIHLQPRGAVRSEFCTAERGEQIRQNSFYQPGMELKRCNLYSIVGPRVIHANDSYSLWRFPDKETSLSL